MNKRDIELLISARDTTGRTFQQVASNIDELTATIEKQVAMAARGEISLQELRQSQEKLAQAGRDLSSLQGQIDGYRKLEAQLEKNKASLATAETAFASFKAELATAEAVTAAQERQLAGLEAKVTTTGAAFRKTQTDVAAASASLEQAGIDTTRLESIQAQIVGTARQAGAGFVQLGGAVDSYSENLRLAQAAESQLAARSTLDKKIAEARQLGDASAFVRLYAQAVDTVGAADQQLGALQGFRQVGQMAAEASRDVSKFAVDASQLATSSDAVAAGLRTIVQPGTEALKTVSGVTAAVEQAAVTLETDKLPVGQYSVALNQLSEASAALLRQGSLVDTFNQQQAAVARARNEFAAAQSEVQRFGAAMANAQNPTEAMVRDLGAAEGKLEQTGRALKSEETRLIALQNQLTAAGIDSRNMAASTDALTAAANRAAGALAKGNSRLGRNGAKAGGFLGLNPFELQNLSFQIQDIFVGLSSGQKPLTVLVQQGTQIAGIFPGLISTVGRFALAWLPVVAVLATVGGAFYKVASDITNLQQATNQLNLRGIGEGFNPEKIVAAGDALEGAGAKAEDAKKAINEVLDATNDPNAFVQITQAAADMATKLGIDVPQATDLLVGVMQGGIEATETLAEKTHLLTNEELDHAQALFDAGKAAEARQYILDTVSGKLAKQADLTSGVFTPAVNNLKTAFNNLIGFFKGIAAPVLDWFTAKISAAIVGFTFLTGLVAGKGFDQSAKEALSAVAPKPKAGGPPPATAQDIKDRQFSRKLDEEELQNRKSLTGQERLRLAATKARVEAQAAGVSKAVEDRAVQQAIAVEQRKINEEGERAAKKQDAAARRAEAAAKRLANQKESAQNQLESELRSLDQATGKGQSATLEERLAVVDSKYQKIFDTLQKMRDLGIKSTSDGTPLDKVVQQVNAQKDLLKQQETLKYYEQQINDLTSQRKDEVAVITDAQQRGAKSVAEAFKDAEAVNGRITPQIVEAAKNALVIAQAIAGTKPSPEMTAMIARLQRIIANEPTNNVAGDVAKAGFADQQTKLNQLLSERNDLVEAYNTLNSLGLQTDRETRDLTAQAFQATAPAIQEQIDKMRESVDLLHQQKDALTGLPIISDAAYNAWIAKLNAVHAGLQNVDSRIAQINTTAENAIAQGVTGAFQTAADTIVGLVAGTMSWGDALNNVFTSALSLAGQFLKAIADVLVQMVALQIAKSLIGGATGGFGAMFFHGGGVVGTGGSRRVRTAGNDNWIGAPVLHGGGGLGLKSDEYKAVLKRGEEVLTENDPRHVRNLGSGGGGSGGGAPALKQVLLLDPAAVPNAMQTRSGQKSILTVIRQNKETIKAVLK